MRFLARAPDVSHARRGGRLWLVAGQTRVSVKGALGYVWVFAGIQDVVYVYADSREGEGGGTYDFSRYVYVSVSAYGVRGMGQQTIISRLLKRGTTGGSPTGTRKRQVFETQAQTVTTSDAANDHGMSGWLGVSPSPGV